MDPKLFRSPEAGRVVKTVTGYWAFLPAIPPPAIVYDSSLALLLSIVNNPFAASKAEPVRG